MKLKYISASFVVALVMPFAASALTVEDIQQQIQSLLAQVAQLQQQLKNLQTEDQTPIACTMEAKSCPDGTSVGRTGSNCEFAACPGVKTVPPIVIRICPQILRTLDQGISGSDVKDLQTYLGVSPTGYFGPATARAVAAFQADEGLSQVGIVGPQTRAAFARRCGWGKGTFSASPTSGVAPLTVYFNATAAQNTSSGNYSIDFGDGTSEQMIAPCSMELGVGCSSNMSANHIYTANGTYSAKLIYQPPAPPCNAPPGAACVMVMPALQGMGTVTVTVGGSTSNASISVSSPAGGTNVVQGNRLSISWNSQSPPAGSVVGLWLVRTRPAGGVQLGCPDSNDPAAFPCGSINLGLIATGQPTSGSYTWTVPAAVQTTSGCISGSTAFDCIQTYANMPDLCPQDAAEVCGSKVTAGSYQIVAKLYTPSDACLGGFCPLANRPTILASSYSGVFTVGGSTSGGAPSISGLDAPTTLSVGQTGTWTVRASVPDQANSRLSYSVTWGDEAYDGIGSPNAQASAARLQTSATFTHTYQRAGTFNPVFTVSNGSGSAQTSASVTVGNVLACTAMYRICPAGTHNGGQCHQDCIPDNTSTTFSASSCTTPWGNKTVSDGQTVSSQPYFSNGTYSGSAVVPLVRCVSGIWYMCNWQGNNCNNRWDGLD